VKEMKDIVNFFSKKLKIEYSNLNNYSAYRKPNKHAIEIWEYGFEV
jgi:hypothetical protein